MRFRFKLFILISVCLFQINIAALDPLLFSQQLNKPTPCWMVEQIEHNLKPFDKELSEQYLDRLFKEYGDFFMLVRIKVVRGELSVEKSKSAEPYELTDLIVSPLIMLHSLAPLPDIDFIFTCRDSFDTPRKAIRNSDPDGATWPIFMIAKNKNDKGLVLMPDWYALRDYQPDKSQIIKGTEVCPWQAKQKVLFFRGADSGVYNRADWRNAPRPTLVALSTRHPDLIDAKFHCLLPYEEDSSIRDIIKQEGMMGNYVPIESFSSYRYLIDVDGHTANTPRTALYLHSKSVMFKQVTNDVLWFYTTLKPYVHYIPVKEDLSDLISRIMRAKRHDKVCRKIAINAFQLAQEVLTPEATYLYFYRLLEAYSIKQKASKFY